MRAIVRARKMGFMDYNILDTVGRSKIVDELVKRKEEIENNPDISLRFHLENNKDFQSLVLKDAREKYAFEHIGEKTILKVDNISIDVRSKTVSFLRITYDLPYSLVESRRVMEIFCEGGNTARSKLLGFFFDGSFFNMEYKRMVDVVFNGDNTEENSNFEMRVESAEGFNRVVDIIKENADVAIPVTKIDKNGQPVRNAACQVGGFKNMLTTNAKAIKSFDINEPLQNVLTRIHTEMQNRFHMSRDFLKLTIVIDNQFSLNKNSVVLEEWTKNDNGETQEIKHELVIDNAVQIGAALRIMSLQNRVYYDSFRNINDCHVELSVFDGDLIPIGFIAIKYQACFKNELFVQNILNKDYSDMKK